MLGGLLGPVAFAAAMAWALASERLARVGVSLAAASAAMTVLATWRI